MPIVPYAHSLATISILIHFRITVQQNVQLNTKNDLMMTFCVLKSNL